MIWTTFTTVTVVPGPLVRLRCHYDSRLQTYGCCAPHCTVTFPVTAYVPLCRYRTPLCLRCGWVIRCWFYLVDLIYYRLICCVGYCLTTRYVVHPHRFTVRWTVAPRRPPHVCSRTSPVACPDGWLVGWLRLVTRLVDFIAFTSLPCGCRTFG